MTRSIDALARSFRKPSRDLIRVCGEAGHIIVPFSTLRTPIEQAQIWRSTRGKKEIDAKINRLRGHGANYIAGIIRSVGPQYPAPGVRGHLTRAVPGRSWHNWGHAIDFYVKAEDGSAIWDEYHEGYETMAVEAEYMGLTAGKNFSTPDCVHIQHYPDNPKVHYGGWKALDHNLETAYG